MSRNQQLSSSELDRKFQQYLRLYQANRKQKAAPRAPPTEQYSRMKTPVKQYRLEDSPVHFLQSRRLSEHKKSAETGRNYSETTPHPGSSSKEATLQKQVSPLVGYTRPSQGASLNNPTLDYYKHKGAKVVPLQITNLDLGILNYKASKAVTRQSYSNQRAPQASTPVSSQSFAIKKSDMLAPYQVLNSISDFQNKANKYVKQDQQLKKQSTKLEPTVEGKGMKKQSSASIEPSRFSRIVKNNRSSVGHVQNVSNCKDNQTQASGRTSRRGSQLLDRLASLQVRIGSIIKDLPVQ